MALGLEGKCGIATRGRTRRCGSASLGLEDKHRVRGRSRHVGLEGERGIAVPVQLGLVGDRGQTWCCGSVALGLEGGGCGSRAKIVIRVDRGMWGLKANVVLWFPCR